MAAERYSIKSLYVELMKTFMRRSASGEFRWVGTLYPTNAYAQDAEMSLDEYEDFVYSACLPDPDDPVAQYTEEFLSTKLP